MMSGKRRPPRGAVLAGVLAVVVVALLAALVQGSSPQEPGPGLSGTNECRALPRKIGTPTWYPADLPMPPGSYVSDEPAGAAGVNRVVWTSKGSLRDFVRWAFGEWPGHGWSLGTGEFEQDLVENNFNKGSERLGTFRARNVYCEDTYTEVLLVLTGGAPA